MTETAIDAEKAFDAESEFNIAMGTLRSILDLINGVSLHLDGCDALDESTIYNATCTALVASRKANNAFQELLELYYQLIRDNPPDAEEKKLPAFLKRQAD